MSEKQKDNKGRILRTGESQRKDLTYQFRYTDVMGKRRTVYANDLHDQGKKKRQFKRIRMTAFITAKQMSPSSNCWNATPLDGVMHRVVKT